MDEEEETVMRRNNPDQRHSQPIDGDSGGGGRITDTHLRSPPKPNPKFLAFVLQALVMAVVISLFFLFVGIAAIVLVHICIAGRALHRRRNRRPTTRFSDSSDDELDFGNVGLSLNEIQYLPSFVYEEGFELGSTIDCAICMEGFKDGERCRMLSSCKHVFHANCIDSWLVKVAACPICRGVVELKREIGGGSTEASSQYVKEVGVVGVLRRVGGSIGSEM